MPAQQGEQTVIRTRLADARVRHPLTQTGMARQTGISYASYVRLERGQHPNPPVRWLANCALVLGVPLEDIIEDRWREWLVLDHSHAPEPPQAD